MEEETTTENEIDAQHQANMALLQELDPVAFNKYDFEFDTILQRLPTGMKPEDTIESHKERCVEEMTETHQFETMELADKFIKHRFADFKLEEENAEHRLYVCPHGQHEQCTGYAKVFLNVGVNIVRACFGHYGHETSIGQYRFTGIQFATIRLFTDFYWKKIVGPGWNVHNIVYCFKHWYDDSHALHYLSIYDLRAIATELGRPEAATVQLPNGVYHAFRMTSIEDMSHFAHRTPSNQFQPCHTDVKNIPAEEVPSLNSEGSSGPPQVLNENGDPVVSAHDEACDSCFRSFQSTAIKPPQEWYSEGANTQKVITMWHNIHNHATELKNIAFMKMLHPECTEEVFNDAQQIFEMLNQAAEIAHNMNEKIRKANGDMSQVPDLEQPPTFSVSLNDPIFQELYPNPHPDYMCLAPELVGPDEKNEKNEPNGFVNGGRFDLRQLFSNWVDPARAEMHLAVAEKDFQEFQKARATKNIWTMPLPRTNFVPARFRYATGLNLHEKVKEFREREEQFLLDQVRKLTFKESAKSGVVNYAREEEEEEEDDDDVEEEEEKQEQKPLSKNKKKKNKKKNKKNKAKEFQNEQPLRHLDP